MPARVFYFALFAAVLLLRLCHSDIVWVEEGYPLAAAAEMLRGKTLYADIWFDKPPLFAGFYLLWGALAGWPMRVSQRWEISGLSQQATALHPKDKSWS